MWSSLRVYFRFTPPPLFHDFVRGTWRSRYTGLKTGGMPRVKESRSEAA